MRTRYRNRRSAYLSVETMLGHARCCQIIERNIAKITRDPAVRRVAYSLAVGWFNKTGGDWAPGHAELLTFVEAAKDQCKPRRNGGK